MICYFQSFRQDLLKAIPTLFPGKDIPEDALRRITVEPPKDPSHGDLATNAALILSKVCQENPRVVGAHLQPFIESLEQVARVEIAGPGFVNVTYKISFWQKAFKAFLETPTPFLRPSLGNHTKVNVEYVSANPTGPMHIGHCRGAVVGDALSALLTQAHYDVTKEYYMNDVGGQVDLLASSLYHHYETFFEMSPSEDLTYPGAYVYDAAVKIAHDDGNKWLKSPKEVWLPRFKEKGVKAMMAMIRHDLKGLGIEHDVFTSEKSLQEKGIINKALDILKSKDLLYKGRLDPPKGQIDPDYDDREQLLFKATEFGDNSDRAVCKHDGTWTYFAGDIGNHLDKIERGSEILINIWGADHGGYVSRLEAAVAGLTDRRIPTVVKLCQMVKFVENGQPLKMSKRSGTYVTVHDVLEKVGRDPLRFMMLMRKNDAIMDFDMNLVVQQTKDNPVFYVQYACARLHSVLRHAEQVFPGLLQDPDFVKTAPYDILQEKEVLLLVKALLAWPRMLQGAVQSYEPHRVAYYLHQVASLFHALWHRGNEDASLKFIHPKDKNKTWAYLAVLKGLLHVLKAGFHIVGITLVEEM